MAEAKTGKLVHEGGRYFLEVGKQRHEVSTDLADEKDLQALAGKQVSITYSEPIRNIIAIGGEDFRPPRITCYFVGPEFDRGVLVSHPEAQTRLLKKFADAGIISKEVHAKLTK